jgi:hypothetical protein
LTAVSPQRVVIFINVVGCGTRPPNGMRQNRCQVIVGHLSTQRLEPEPRAVLQEHQLQIRLDRDRLPTQPGTEELDVRLEEASSSNNASTRTSSAGIPNASNRQQCFAQRRLLAYRSQHRGSLFGNAITRGEATALNTRASLIDLRFQVEVASQGSRTAPQHLRR